MMIATNALPIDAHHAGFTQHRAFEWTQHELSKKRLTQCRPGNLLPARCAPCLHVLHEGARDFS